MNIQEKQQKMLALYDLVKRANEILRDFVKLNPEAFGEIYRANADFESVMEEVLMAHRAIADKKLH